MLSHSSVVITGGTFTQIGSSQNALERLMGASAPNALHDSSARFDPPTCHPNTRLAVLECIMEWIFGSDDRDALILWLYGPAGAGKSAILQSIAEKCAALDILLASFFFFRSDSTRNHPGSLVATIAYQIATRIPQVTSALDSAISRDPMIFKKSLDTQVQQLIVNPLRNLALSGFFKDRKTAPRLVLIDGLDECNGYDQCRIVLLSIAKALREQNFPLIFLIASRPEEDIRLTFNSTPLAGFWSSLVLDDSFLPDLDIRLFLNDSFQEMKDSHPRKTNIPSAWPAESVVDKLVEKSSGQFIYASVVIKYISMMFDNPTRRLDIVMGLRPPRHDLPFAELDALYMHIISSAPRPDDVKDILAALISLDITGTMEITGVLELEEGDVELAIAPLSSIITCNEGWRFRENNLGMNFTHASFPDFLLDKSRSGQYHIDVAAHQVDFIDRCIEHLSVTESSNLVEATLFEFVVLGELLGLVSVTADIFRKVEQLPLDRIWAAYERFGLIRTQMVFQYLEKISILFSTSTSTDIDYQSLLPTYLNRLRSVFETELAKYMTDHALTACMVSYVMMHPPTSIARQHPYLLIQLLQIDEDLLEIDQRSLALMDNIMTFPYVLRNIYFKPSAIIPVNFSQHDYNQTALRILVYLCRQHQQPCEHTHSWRHFPKRPLRGAPSGAPYQFLIPQGSATPSLARRLRVNFHQRGMYIRLCEEHYPSRVYRAGTKILLRLLEKCSGSEELSAFVRANIRDIVVVPCLTRRILDKISGCILRSED